MANTKLVVLSDTHCGSIYGLCPPDLLLLSGNRLSLNPRQQWLWDGWQWAIDKVHKHCPEGFDLILNGDLQDGRHHGGNEIISPDESDHDVAAIKALEPITSLASNIYVTLGTECHTKTRENAVASVIGAVPSPYGAAWESLYLDFCGTPVFATHHVTTTKRPWLEANGIGMEMTSTFTNYAREGLVPPRVYCYAHRHVYSSVQNATGLAIVNGAWQFLTRYGRKVVPGAVCSPSITILDWSQEEEGGIPIDIPIRIKAPHPIYA